MSQRMKAVSSFRNCFPSIKETRCNKIKSRSPVYCKLTATNDGDGHKRHSRNGEVTDKFPWEIRRQTTLSASVTLSGVGLHSGIESEVILHPAKAGKGRLFLKNTNGEISVVPASLSNVCDTRLSTTIGSKKVLFHTVEHLLSSLEGVGVDNVTVEVRGGNEIPVLDGSAALWVKAILNAGITDALDAEGNTVMRNVRILKEPIEIVDGDSYVKAIPSSSVKFMYEIDFPQLPVVGRQTFEWNPKENLSYLEAIAPARTFGILEQFEQLRAAGLIKGGSLDNALVCSMETGWVNPPLRFPDEPCRHKLLDLIGDLALCSENGETGIPLAHIRAYKASHHLHVKFGKLLREMTSYS